MTPYKKEMSGKHHVKHPGASRKHPEYVQKNLGIA